MPERGKAIQTALQGEVRRAEKVRAEVQWENDHPSGKAAEYNEDHE
jgi:DNA-binding transcriptional regulator YdaS (Cro superfamily)